MISSYQKWASLALAAATLLPLTSSQAENSKLIEWKSLSDPTGIFVDQKLLEKPEIRGQAEAVEETGVMRLNGGSMILGLRDEKIFRELLTKNNELTIELIVLPFSARQDGPARILSYSSDQSSRNFTIGQSSDKFDLRLRTEGADENGHISNSTFGKVEAGVEYKLTVSYKPGRLLIAVNDKVLVERDDLRGSLKNWTAHSLILGDELNGDRVWRGEVRGLSLHNRARELSPKQAKRKAHKKVRDRDPNRELEETRKAVDELKKKVAKMCEERKQMEMRIKAGDKAGAELERQLAAKAGNQGNHADLQRQLAEAQEIAVREHNHAEKITAQVLKQVQAQQTIAAELRETVALIQKERQQLLAKIEQQKKPTTDPAQLKKLTAENQQLSEKLKQAWEKSKQQEKLEAKLAEAEKVLNAERARMAILTKERAQARGTIESLQNELARAKAAHAQLAKQHDDLKTKFDALSKTHDKDVAASKRAHMAHLEHEKKIKELQDELKKHSQTHKASVEKGKADLDKLTAESKQLAAARDAAIARSNQAKAALTACDKKVKALNDELAKAQSTAAEKLNAAIAKNAQLQAQLIAKTAEATKAEEKAISHRAEALRERILRKKMETQIEDAAEKAKAEEAAARAKAAAEHAALLNIAPIYFGKNKADSDAQEKSLVAQVKKIHAKHPQIRFSVTGHTCTDGTAEANLTLSQRRAQRIADLLIKSGIPKESFTEVVGKGQTAPRADNATQQGREANRRVEVTPIEAN